MILLDHVLPDKCTRSGSQNGEIPLSQCERNNNNLK